MSEDTTTTDTAEPAVGDEQAETATAPPPWGSDDDFDPERAWTLIQNLRNEIVDLKPRAARAQELEQAQMSEQERLTAQNEALHADLATERADKARLRAAVLYGLSEEDMSLLDASGTPEDIAKRAEAFAKRLAGTGTTAPPTQRPTERLVGGTRPTEPDPAGDDPLLADLLSKINA